jgi:hypothetical protein
MSGIKNAGYKFSQINQIRNTEDKIKNPAISGVNKRVRFD